MNISYRSILGIAAGCGLMLSTASCSQDFLEQYPSPEGYLVGEKARKQIVAYLTKRINFLMRRF